MRVAAGVVVAALTGVLGSGCSGPAAPPVSSGSSASSSPATSSAFPLRITRSGGIAGFADSVTVGVDGTVQVLVRRLPPRRCTLPADRLAELSEAAAAVDWAALRPPTSDPRMADQLFTRIAAPAGGPADLTDPGLGDLGPLASRLLLAAVGTDAAYLSCAPAR